MASALISSSTSCGLSSAVADSTNFSKSDDRKVSSLSLKSSISAKAIHGSSLSAFLSLSSLPLRSAAINAPSTSSTRATVVMEGAVIQFIRGIDEQSIPDVRLTRSRDGSNGTATFVFDNPSVFDSSRELGDITGLYLIDDEGIIQSVDVSAKFVNGKPAKIEARHIMRNTRDWDRFMRFMEKYAEKYDLGFLKK